METESLSAETDGAVGLKKRVESLTHELAAKQRTIDVLAARVEHALNDNASSVAILHSNLALEQIIQNKTNELEKTYAALKHAQAEILQSSKLTAIGQLAAGIAHEINTPVQYVSDNAYFLDKAFTSLCEFIDVMQSHARDPVTHEATRTLIEAALEASRLDYVLEETPGAIEQSIEGLHRVTEIVGAMKAFSHPSGGTKAPADLADCINSTATITRNVWKYVAELKTEIEPGMPAIPCLRDELNQVLLNLIVNAADAIADANRNGADGLGLITIALRRDGGYAEIRVSDSGTGMPEAVRQRIFEPFFTTKPVGKGTGQGLAIAYSVIVDRHRGAIAVNTEMGRGTTFIVRLPIGEPEQ